MIHDRTLNLGISGNLGTHFEEKSENHGEIFHVRYKYKIPFWAKIGLCYRF